MGRRALVFVMMFGVVGVVMASPTMAPMVETTPIVVPYWGTDTAQPDTIRYDDTGASSYRLYGGVFYNSVRFTPLSPFELRAAYIYVNRVGTDSTGFRVWVARDSIGFANPNRILEVRGPYTPSIGTVLYDVTFQDTLANNLHFEAGQDFHIIYGPINATLNPTPGPGTYPILDGTLSGLNRSYYTTGVWPTNIPTINVAGGYDWRCRAGGRYGGGGWVDLGVGNVDNVSLRYFLCQNDASTFRALINNPGTMDVATYNVQWDVRDAGNIVVFTTTGTYGPLVAGSNTTVTAPAAWNATTLGEFIMTATVTAAGDVTPENNSKMLEQQVDDPALAHLLDYDIPNFQVNLSIGANGGRIMKFTPCQMPVEITSLQVELISTAGNALIRIYGDNGSGAPNPASVLFSTTAALIVGNNVIPVPSVAVATGSFFVAYQYADATTPTIPMDAEPNAGTNLTMGVEYVTSDGGATWTLTAGGDHPLRAMVMPAGGIIRDISLDWMTFPGFFGPGSDPFAGDIQVTNNGTATDTFDVSLVIQDTTFARTVVFSQTLPVVGLAVGDSTEVTFDPYTFTTVGEYILTTNAIVPGDANPSDNMISAETQICAYPSELTYDDGTMENGWAFNTAGYYWGARFDPPIYPCKITGMKVYFNSFPAGSDDSRMKIYDDDGTTVRYDFLDTAIETGWNTYVVPGLPVIDGFFYAGTEWVTAYPTAPFIGTDTNTPISYMARQLIAGVWYYDIEEAGVRVTVEATKVKNVVIQKTGGTDNVNINLSWNLAGAPSGTWFFIYKSDTPTGTYALVDSVAYPTQTWNDTNVPGFNKYYHVTFGNASGARALTLPGEYLWAPIEIGPTGVDAVEPGIRPFAAEKVRQATSR